MPDAKMGDKKEIFILANRNDGIVGHFKLIIEFLQIQKK